MSAAPIPHEQLLPAARSSHRAWAAKQPTQYYKLSQNGPSIGEAQFEL